MKKALVVITALLFFAGFSTLTSAQEQKPVEPPATEQKAPEAPAPEQKATEAPAPEQKAEVIQGKIVSVNVSGDTKTMVVKAKSGAEKTIAVDQIDQAVLSTLKAGESVKVTLKAGEDKAEKVEVVKAKGKVRKGGKKK